MSICSFEVNLPCFNFLNQNRFPTNLFLNCALSLLEATQIMLKTFLALLIMFCLNTAQSQEKAQSSKPIKNIKYYEATQTAKGFVVKHSYDSVMVKGSIMDHMYETVEAFAIVNNEIVAENILSTYKEQAVENKFFFYYMNELLVLFFVKEGDYFTVHLALMNRHNFEIQELLLTAEKQYIFSPHELGNSEGEDVGFYYISHRRYYFDKYIDYNGNFIIDYGRNRITVDSTLVASCLHYKGVWLIERTRTPYNVKDKGVWRGKSNELYLVAEDEEIFLGSLLKGQLIEDFRKNGFKYKTTKNSKLIYELDSLTHGDTSTMIFSLHGATAEESAEEINFTLEFDLILDLEDAPRGNLWNIINHLVYYHGVYNKLTGECEIKNYFPKLLKENAPPLEEILQNPFWSKKIWENDRSELFIVEMNHLKVWKYSDYYQERTLLYKRDKSTGSITRLLDQVSIAQFEIKRNELDEEWFFFRSDDWRIGYIPLLDIDKGPIPFSLYGKKKQFKKYYASLDKFYFSEGQIWALLRKAKDKGTTRMKFELLSISTPIKRR